MSTHYVRYTFANAPPWKRVQVIGYQYEADAKAAPTQCAKQQPGGEIVAEYIGTVCLCTAQNGFGQRSPDGLYVSVPADGRDVTHPRSQSMTRRPANCTCYGKTEWCEACVAAGRDRQVVYATGNQSRVEHPHGT